MLETPIPENVATEIAALAGVRAIDILRVLPGQIFRGERIAIAGSSDGLSDPARHPPGWYYQVRPRKRRRACGTERARASREVSPIALG